METFDTATLPLSGLRLIEASAGTGKTFSLAGLYLRLIIEKRASVRDILVMTFTTAATQELRKRIHQRLERAAIIARDRNLARQDDPEDKLTCHILDHMDEAGESLARRLRDMAEQIDEATIVTIHGFARRAVEENAFDSALAFDRGNPVDASEIFRQAATDYWRRAVFGPGNMGLQTLWATPEKLYQAIRVILEKPHARLSGTDQNRLDTLTSKLKQSWPDTIGPLSEALVEAWDHDALKKGPLKSAILQAGDPKTLIDTLDQHITTALEQQHVPVLPAWVATLDQPQNQFDGRSKSKKALAEPLKTLPALSLLAELQPLAELVITERAATATARLAETRKVQQRQYSYDDLIVALHQALHNKTTGVRLATALFERWPYALVDEFQDTDPLQYASLRAIYQPRVDDRGALLLIGDPKQAIYGFRGGDIYAYLEASREATARYTQTTNYRSTAAVLSAIETLYQLQPAAPFVVPEIDFPRIRENPDANRPELISADGSPWSALTIWQLHGSQKTDAKGRPKKPAKSDDEARLIDETIAALGKLLHSEPACWRKPDGSIQPVQPGDIAILVNTNAEAAKLQKALAHKGIRAVCQHRTSVYTSPEADELTWVMRAMAGPSDAGAVRTAHTTRLLGKHLIDLIQLADDDRAMQTATEYFHELHDQWRRHGVLSALEQLFAAAAPNLLARVDGERRMSNYLQLGELLADAETQCFGMANLIHWLSRRMVEATEGRLGMNEQSELRLESDAKLIRISTIHAAKGLEYPIVFMPFASELGTWTHGSAKNPEKPPLVFHSLAGKQSEALIDLIGKDDAHIRQSVTETRSENLRLLYVALTRAKQAIVIGWRDPDAKGSNGALADLLYRDGIEARGRFEQLATQYPDLFTVQSIDTTQAAPATAHIPPTTDKTLGHARCDLPDKRPHWGSYSFSRLAHATVESQTDALAEYGATDENTPPLNDVTFTEDSPAIPKLDERLSGTRFGSAVHDLLEEQLKQGGKPWPKPGQPPTDEQHEQVCRKLRQYGLLDENNGDARVGDTIGLIARTLHTPLPGIGALADISRACLLTEMEFLLRLGGHRLDDLIATLREYSYLQTPLGGHPAQELYGLMQGFIDLIVEVDGRYYILDYKTNNLGDTVAAYSETNLKQAVDRAHYDLQYLIYSVALHRHLRYSLGPDYNPAQHLGAVHYLFVRAMDGATSAGIHTDQPDIRLIERLDELFDAASQ